MSATFGSASTSVQPKSMDPTKHVNYVLGMVLGQDDFIQEFTYLSERDRWMVRELLGYGTAWGLAVTCREKPKKEPPELEVVVTPGVAVSPSGQLIRVAPEQCASLHGWLAAHDKEVQDLLWNQEGSDTGNNKATLQVYVVLSFRERLTDDLPIPGEPCRSEENAMQSSRITDGFRLELRLEPPAQGEEQDIRVLMRWLQENLEPNPLAGGTTEATLMDFLQRMREQWPGTKKPSPPAKKPSPPAKQMIPPGELETYLRAAFRVWVTELRRRPPLTGDEAQQAEDVVLLAGLGLPFTRVGGKGSWELATADHTQVRVSEEHRPLLLSLRLLQEWLLQGLFTPVGIPPAAPQPQPKPAPPVYEVVAAGVVKGIDEPGREDTYGDLRALSARTGEILFTFEDYEYPLFRESGYLVKVLPYNCSHAHVVFCTFEPQGFVVKVFNPDGTPMEEKQIQQLKFVIEVSYFPLGAMP